MEDTDLSIRHEDLLARFQTEAVADHVPEKYGATFTCRNGVSVQLEFIASGIVKVAYHLPDSSQAPGSYILNPRGLPFSRPEVDVKVAHGELMVSSDDLIAAVDVGSGKLIMKTPRGEVLQEDREGFLAVHSMNKGVTKVEIDLCIEEGALFFGLGDKAGRLQLLGQRLENWNTDAYAYGVNTDPLYRSIPFFMGLRDEQAFGLLLDNSYRSVFDFGATETESLRISAAGGELVYYFMTGSDLSQVARHYALLTGLPGLPPLWALGYHQCRWSYFPDTRVREVASQFRELSIPCDAIYLDIDYMHGYRCFTWDTERFPDPADLVQSLQESGFHTVVMIDPGIKQEAGYAIYDEGFKQDFFCRRPDGSLMVGPVWPGPCVFPDFTRQVVRDWWGDLYRNLYQETGIGGFWNDMNEPAVFRLSSMTFPDEVMHDFEGHPVHHARVHNVYGMQMTRATTEGLARLDPERRPFVLTRASYSGGQRYAAVWTGDNISTWEHLAIANRQCQRLSISGFSFCGSDIGGFVDRPEPELFLRWVQLGVFHPLFRTHSMGNHASGAEAVDEESLLTAQADDRMDQEPWAFGEPFTSHCRSAIELRYQLLGYLYTAFRVYVTSGQPILTPLAFFNSSDATCRKREREFLFGPHLLVSPVLNPGQREQAVYFPPGTWYNYHSQQTIDGPGFVRVEAPLDHIPLFVRAGAIIPLYPVRQHTGESIQHVELRVYYSKGKCHSEWYDDSGEGYDFEKGDYLDNMLDLTGYSGALELIWQRKGGRQPEWTTVTLQFIGIPFEPRLLRIDDQEVVFRPTDLGWEAVWEESVFTRCLLE